VLAKGDAIIVWACQGAKCCQHKENVLVGGPIIVFCL